jgi:hypothetical protein
MSVRRREDELISVQQTREKAFNNTQLRQDKIKEAFDRRTKVDDFKLGDWVLNGMPGMRIKGNMENLITCGWAHSKLQLTMGKMPIC